MISELKNLKWLAIITLILGLMIQIPNLFIVNSNSTLNSNLHLWEVAEEFYVFLFPLFSSNIFCFFFFHEVNDNYLNFVHNRIKKKDYIKKKYLSGLLMSTMITILLSLIPLLISLYMFQINNLSEELLVNQSFLGEYKHHFPFIYGVILSIWRGIIGTTFYTLSFKVIFLTKNFFVFFTATFIYYLLENFTLSTLGMPQFSITTSLMPNRLNSQLISFTNLSIGVILILIIILILDIAHKISNKI